MGGVGGEAAQTTGYKNYKNMEVLFFILPLYKGQYEKWEKSNATQTKEEKVFQHDLRNKCKVIAKNCS